MFNILTFRYILLPSTKLTFPNINYCKFLVLLKEKNCSIVRFYGSKRGSRGIKFFWQCHLLRLTIWIFSLKQNMAFDKNNLTSQFPQKTSVLLLSPPNIKINL